MAGPPCRSRSAEGRKRHGEVVTLRQRVTAIAELMGPAPRASESLLTADEPRRLDESLRVRWRPKVHDIACSAKAWQEKPVCRDLGRLGRVLRDVTRSPPDVFLRDVDNLELPAPANATAAGRYLHRLD